MCLRKFLLLWFAWQIDAAQKPRAFLRLLNECEKTKKLMSANSTPIPINIECFMEDKDVSGKLKREDLEQLAAPLVKRFEAICTSALEASGEWPLCHVQSAFSGPVRGSKERDVAKAVGQPPVKVSIVRSILHGGCICSLGCFLFPPVVHNWSIKGCGVLYVL